ncbi:tRNA pseudouridine synthase A [Rosa sericea]
MENPDNTKATRSPPPPPPQQPDPKKLKMSTTTTDDEETAATTTTTQKQRIKRRKVAIFFAYCGVGYQGMQKNPGAKTIEGDLEEALYLSGAVPEQDRNNPKRYDWARSARTDKGVSAVGQVVSGRFYVDPPGFVDRLNSNLSPQIRIFGYKRVTASFNAKKFCDRRRYVYLIPVFALDPSAHRDRESVKASLGSDEEFVKCLECSDRGRKVGGLMGKRTYELRGDSSNSESVNGISTNDDTHMKNGIANDIGVSEVEVEDNVVVANADMNSEVNGEEKKAVKGGGFCYGEKEKERFNRILSCYQGTHNFHNFTTRTKAEDPAATRFIISFTANTTVTVEGIEFVKCEVVGQSFMLHQIRKLIGLAVAIMRNCAPESLLERALQKDVNVNVPTAPEVGLYLDECFFSSYNQKWGDTHEEVSMKDYEAEAEAFKMKHIYTHIGATEHKEGVVGLWLHSLNHRNYPDLGADNNGDTSIKQTADISGADNNGDTSNGKTADISSADNNGDTSNGKTADIASADNNGDTSNGKTADISNADNNGDTSNGKTADIASADNNGDTSNGKTADISGADNKGNISKQG